MTRNKENGDASSKEQWITYESIWNNIDSCRWHINSAVGDTELLDRLNSFFHFRAIRMVHPDDSFRYVLVFLALA